MIALLLKVLAVTLVVLAVIAAFLARYVPESEVTDMVSGTLLTFIVALMAWTAGEFFDGL